MNQGITDNEYTHLDTVSLIQELQGLEYLDIDYIQGVPLLYCCDDTDNRYPIDTRVITSIIEELYENEYYEFVKEFNEYMEYNEVYD